MLGTKSTMDTRTGGMTIEQTENKNMNKPDVVDALKSEQRANWEQCGLRRIGITAEVIGISAERDLRK